MEGHPQRGTSTPRCVDRVGQPPNQSLGSSYRRIGRTDLPIVTPPQHERARRSCMFLSSSGENILGSCRYRRATSIHLRTAIQLCPRQQNGLGPWNNRDAYLFPYACAKNSGDAMILRASASMRLTRTTPHKGACPDVNVPKAVLVVIHRGSIRQLSRQSPKFL
jgi:hypothetical protein